MSGFRVRLRALLRKEWRQMVRDRGTMLVGLLLPVALILLFGYGLSFDVARAPVAVVMEDTSPPAREALAGIGGSRWLVPVSADSMAQATALLRAHRVEAIVRVPVDFAQRRAAGSAVIDVVLNGTDTTTASALDGYIAGAIGTATLIEGDRSAAAPPVGTITVAQRVWFNEPLNSRWYLVPGLLVLVITLIGAFLTSLLIAREWERGTLEALFVTPVGAVEIMLAKLIPYLAIGLVDIALCLLSARFVFAVPIRGSLAVIVLAALLYLLVALLLGLLISGLTRNQFAASQMALLTSFLPAMMLSGFVFDLRNTPPVIQVISQLLPATHFMQVIKTLFLAGTLWSTVLPGCAVLAGYGVVLALATARTLRKRLDL